MSVEPSTSVLALFWGKKFPNKNESLAMREDYSSAISVRIKLNSPPELLMTSQTQSIHFKNRQVIKHTCTTKAKISKFSTIW